MVGQVGKVGYILSPRWSYRVLYSCLCFSKPLATLLIGAVPKLLWQLFKVPCLRTGRSEILIISFRGGLSAGPNYIVWSGLLFVFGTICPKKMLTPSVNTEVSTHQAAIWRKKIAYRPHQNLNLYVKWVSHEVTKRQTHKGTEGLI